MNFPILGDTAAPVTATQVITEPSYVAIIGLATGDLRRMARSSIAVSKAAPEIVGMLIVFGENTIGLAIELRRGRLPTRTGSPRRRSAVRGYRRFSEMQGRV